MKDTNRRGESTDERRYGVLSDRRGVSEVLGAILVFALVLAVLVLIQVAAVPAANQQVEFEHNQRVQGDLQDFDEAVARTGSTGAPGAVAIETGIRYPPRLFLLNPPPAAGALTTEPGSMQISNAIAVDDETSDYLNSSLPAYDTVALSYTPDYNEYANPPTTRYEGWVMYNQFEDANLVLDSGSFISGRRVSITVLDGSLSTTSVRPTTLNTDPLSAPSQEVSIQGDGGPITLTFTSQLPASEWRDVLADEQYVDDVQPGPGADQVTITLQHMENGEVITYDLRMAKVGIGSRTTEPEATYVTKVGPASQLASANGTEFTVEVRDQFNNPVSGESVTFTSDDGFFTNGQPSIVVPTDENGHATALFFPGQGKQTVTVNAGRDLSGDGFVNDEDARNRVQFRDFQVLGGTQPPSPGDEINPVGEGAVELVDIQRQTTCQPSQDRGCAVNVTFENTDTLGKAPVSMRINAYSAAAPGASASDLPAYIEVWDQNDAYTENVDLFIRGQYETTTHLDDFSGGEMETYSFLIRDGDGDRYEAAADEFFYLTVIYSDGSKGTYLITL